MIIASMYVLLMPTLNYHFIQFEGMLAYENPNNLGFLIIIYSFIVHLVFLTGFLEEVGFRGFLGKRLISKFGFIVGNTLQAVVFGFGHNIIGLYISGRIEVATEVFMITGGFGWIAGYLTEKQVGGSIYPAWILHTMANRPIFNFVFFG